MKQEQQNAKTGGLALLGTGFILGSFGYLIHQLNQTLSINNQIIFRYGLAGILLCLIIVMTKTRLKITKSSLVPLITFAIFMQLDVFLFTKGVVVGSIQTTLGSLYIGSLIVSSLADLILFKEKITKQKVIINGFALTGLIILITSKEISMPSVMYGILAGGCETITNIVRKMCKNVSKGVITLFAILGNILVTSSSMLIIREQFTLPTDLKTWIFGILFAFAIIATNILVTIGFRNISMNIGSIIISSEIAFAAIISWILLNHAPTTTDWLVGVCIMIAILIQNVQIPTAKIVATIKSILEN